VGGENEDASRALSSLRKQVDTFRLKLETSQLVPRLGESLFR